MIQIVTMSPPRLHIGSNDTWMQQGSWQIIFNEYILPWQKKNPWKRLVIQSSVSDKINVTSGRSCDLEEIVFDLLHLYYESVKNISKVLKTSLKKERPLTCYLQQQYMAFTFGFSCLGFCLISKLCRH